MVLTNERTNERTACSSLSLSYPEIKFCKIRELPPVVSVVTHSRWKLSLGILKCTFIRRNRKEHYMWDVSVSNHCLFFIFSFYYFLSLLETLETKNRGELITIFLTTLNKK